MCALENCAGETLGVAFLATLALGAAFLARRATPPHAAPARTMIAVLPLDDLTGDRSTVRAPVCEPRFIALIERIRAAAPGTRH